MFLEAKPMMLLCETSLHAGSGSDLGIVDLPIQRERSTRLPKVESSSLKGSLRETIREQCQSEQDHLDLHLAFGLDDSSLPDEPRTEALKAFKSADSKFAGALGISDARLLVFPIKSMKGVFAWATCPTLLARMKKDFSMVKAWPDDLVIPEELTIPTHSNLLIGQNNVALEEYTFTVSADEQCGKFAQWLSGRVFPIAPAYEFWKTKLSRDLIVLPDDDFRDFIELSTEVITRTRIDQQTGTVAPGALFTEEYLPSETIFYALTFASGIFQQEHQGSFQKETASQQAKAVLDYLTRYLQDSVFQLGANATLGKGLIRVKLL